MEKNDVFILIGQRGAGKSTYGAKLQKEYPGQLQAVSRDEIMIRKFGRVHTDGYCGELHYAYHLMHRLLRHKLAAESGVAILLDCWMGTSRERKEILRILRQHGANKVTALYFVTPLELVEQWFWEKPGIAKFGDHSKSHSAGTAFFPEDAPLHDYHLFHKHAADINADGFDHVIRVHPLEDLVSLP